MSLITIVVHSQEELDKFALAENVWLKIAFGSPANPAKVNKQLKYPVSIEPGYCAAIYLKNKVRRSRRCTILAYDESVISAVNSTVYATDTAYVVTSGESKVILADCAYADLWDESHAITMDDSYVEAHDDSTVQAYDASQIILWDSATVVVKGHNVEVERSSDVPASAIAYHLPPLAAEFEDRETA